MKRFRAVTKSHLITPFARDRNRKVIVGVYCLIFLLGIVTTIIYGVAAVIVARGPFDNAVKEFKDVADKTSGARWSWSSWVAAGGGGCSSISPGKVILRKRVPLFEHKEQLQEQTNLPVMPPNYRQSRRCGDLAPYVRLTDIPWSGWSRWCDQLHNSYRWRAFGRLRTTLVIDSNEDNDYVQRKLKGWCFHAPTQQQVKMP